MDTSMIMLWEADVEVYKHMADGKIIMKGGPMKANGSMKLDYSRECDPGEDENGKVT